MTAASTAPGRRGPTREARMAAVATRPAAATPGPKRARRAGAPREDAGATTSGTASWDPRRRCVERDATAYHDNAATSAAIASARHDGVPSAAVNRNRAVGGAATQRG